MHRNHFLSALLVGPFALFVACSTTPNPGPGQTASSSSSSSSSNGEAGAGGVAGMGGMAGAGGMAGTGGMAGSGGSMMAAVPKPDFGLMDVNPNSATSGQTISPRDYVGQVSAWYFGHAT